MLRTVVVSALTLVALAGSAALAERKGQPVTPAVKALTNGAAMKYVGVICAGSYGYTVSTPATAGGFDTMYKQLSGIFGPLKARGLRFDYGRSGQSFWALSGDSRGSALHYTELRGGSLHAYVCALRP